MGYADEAKIIIIYFDWLFFKHLFKGKLTVGKISKGVSLSLKEVPYYNLCTFTANTLQVE